MMSMKGFAIKERKGKRKRGKGRRGEK